MSERGDVPLMKIKERTNKPHALKKMKAIMEPGYSLLFRAGKSHAHGIMPFGLEFPDESYFRRN
jgi:hypothetical protein